MPLLHSAVKVAAARQYRTSLKDHACNHAINVTTVYTRQTPSSVGTHLGISYGAYFYFYSAYLSACDNIVSVHFVPGYKPFVFPGSSIIGRQDKISAELHSILDVVTASSPNPVILLVLSFFQPATITATIAQILQSTVTRHRVDNSCHRNCVDESCFSRTYRKLKTNTANWLTVGN